MDFAPEELDFSLDNIKFAEHLKQLFIKCKTEKENIVVPLFDDDLNLINAARGEKHHTEYEFGRDKK